MLQTTVLAFVALSSTPTTQESQQIRSNCDAVWRWLFTPRHPVLGRYQVCIDPRPLSELAGTGWVIEPTDALDAFGRAGLYNRAALARVYGGLHPTVARRWNLTSEAFESLTLIFPSPDSTLTRLEPATLVVRWTCDIRETGCPPFTAR